MTMQTYGKPDPKVVAYFLDAFEEVIGLPLKREIEFSIMVLPNMTPDSRAPYRTAPVELTELKKQVQKLFDKEFIRLSTAPWSALVNQEERWQPSAVQRPHGVKSGYCKE